MTLVKPHLERFEEKFIPEPNTGCWLWLGAISENEYGRFHYRGTNWHAHRVAWELYRGPIPDGLVLDHIVCRTHCCVNPDHLRLVTPRINTLENSLSWSGRKASRKNCSKCGGPYSLRSDGKGRICLACAKITRRRAWKAYDERQRAKKSLSQGVVP